MNTVEWATPSPCRLGQNKIYELAELIGGQLGYKPGDALDNVVARLGGSINFQPLFDLGVTSSGSIEVRDEGDFKIYLANHTSESRDRFTISHELGHYVLHFLYPRSIGTELQNLKASRYGSGIVEFEANWFAAAFLMPSSVFVDDYSRFHGDIDLLANKYKVSNQAAEVRVKALKLS